VRVVGAVMNLLLVITIPWSAIPHHHHDAPHLHAAPIPDATQVGDHDPEHDHEVVGCHGFHHHDAAPSHDAQERPSLRHDHHAAGCGTCQIIATRTVSPQPDAQQPARPLVRPPLRALLLGYPPTLDRPPIV
jgi:hypothetical protein